MASSSHIEGTTLKPKTCAPQRTRNGTVRGATRGSPHAGTDLNRRPDGGMPLGQTFDPGRLAGIDSQASPDAIMQVMPFCMVMTMVQVAPSSVE